MVSVFAQVMAVVAMNIRSLPKRIWMSLATLLAVAIVVAVLLGFLAMSNGFQQTLKGTGSEALAVILREGSQAELNSVLLREQYRVIETAPGIALDAEGPIVSGELYIIVTGKKKTTGTDVNLPLRGLDNRGIAMRENISIVAGRIFEPGTNEIVVGEAILKEFSGFELNKTIRLNNIEWTVVGVFAAGGSVFSSELWADSKTVQSQFNRGSSYQIMRVKLAKSGEITPLKEFFKNDPRLNLDVWTESDYYSEQSKGMADLIFYLGWPLSIAMALGALAGALNTMYTSVAQRAVEIATLRAIGFSGMSAFFGTLVESLVLSVIGGLLGAVAAYLFFDGITASTLGGSFTQIVFDFEISGDGFLQAIKLALVIGLIGGVLPAYRAAKLPVIVAFRR
ncbi:ABC transporter permease [Teredinibacter haidensis]|uniref:ABC transporter permease n=1 Tax=Teredinibacter haidensis TaxID=2731755 RepID=UPI000948B27E|nr:ABC transporter permease [Teredinibacter haidensis]